MKVLNRKWKNNNTGIFYAQNIKWKKGSFIVEITGNILWDGISVNAKLRNNKDINVKAINVEKHVLNQSRILYKATFDSNSFNRSVNSIWDFYIVDNKLNNHRLVSNIDFNNIGFYKLEAQDKELEPYYTIQNNLSLKLVKADSKLITDEITIDKDNFNIKGNLFTCKKVKEVHLSVENKMIKKCKSVGIKNNYLHTSFEINISLKKLFDLFENNKTMQLELNITYDDFSTESLMVQAPKLFEDSKIINKDRNILLYKNNDDNVFIKIIKKEIEAQITTIYSYEDRFEINGFVRSLEKINIMESFFVLKNREKDEEFKILQNLNEDGSFCINIHLNDLTDRSINNGIWDLYVSLGNDLTIRLESTLDDIDNKQKVISIPQQMASIGNDTFVYKLYYTLENQISLLVRKYIYVKKIDNGIISDNDICLEGYFFVEPPAQLLPSSFEGTLNIAGYYKREYELKINILTEQSENKYYTKFKFKADIGNLDDDKRRNIKLDLLSNMVSINADINGFPINIMMKIDGKSIEEKTNKFNRFIKYKRSKKFELLYKALNNIIPMNNNMAIYQSFHGKSYSCSPKAVHEYLSDIKGYKGIWVLDNEYTEVPDNTIIVKPNTLRYYYYMIRAKYFVNNGNFPDFYEKREKAIHLQTWHGTPLKKLGADIDIKSPSYKENNSHELKRRNSRWDYLIGPNKYTSDILKRAFEFNKTMLDTGYPRNDVLYRYKDIDKVNTIKEKLGIHKDKKVILYAPTWRDSDFHSGQSNQPYNLKFDIEKFKEKFSDEYVLLLRLHYRDASRLSLGKDDIVINASFYDDIQELYLISDMLITDYSSVMFDYANLKRPMIFYCYDYKKYKNQMRGCYFNFASAAPGPLVFDDDQLFEAIDNIEDVKVLFKDKLDSFYESFCSWEDGQATKRVVNEVFKTIS